MTNIINTNGNIETLLAGVTHVFMAIGSDGKEVTTGIQIYENDLNSVKNNTESLLPVSSTGESLG